MRLTVFVCGLLFLPWNIALADEGAFASTKKGLGYQWHDGGYITIGVDSEMGTWHDDGVYASFGLEHQIFRFSKIVFPVKGRSKVNHFGHFWIFRVDFAPLYDSIKREDRTPCIYGNDPSGHDINGTNFYFDWYKNFGSRVYYLGSVPLIEAYAGYRALSHTLTLGRLKNIVGFRDREVFWGDDAKFAPMAYWLSRDLLSGIIYTYNQKWFEAQAAVFSGNNPMKGYAHYLGGIQSPQTKANNTPTLSANVRLFYGDWFAPEIDGFLFGSYQANTINSTWEDRLNDGKRNSNLGALGALCHISLEEKDSWIQGITFLGQYTCYTSGLKPNSAQNNGHPRFRTIRQQGFFLSVEGNFLDCLSLAAAYEAIDRFDYNVYAYSQFGLTPLLPIGARQKSYIFQIIYNLNDYARITGAYHILNNPIPFVSDVLDNRGDNRYKLTLSFQI